MNNNTAKHPHTVPKPIIGDLAEVFKRSFQTIQNWIKDGDDRLTSDKARAIYEKHNYTYVPTDLVNAGAEA